MGKIPQQLTITAYPRLHLSLLDLSPNGFRRNGGIGFAFSTPSITVSVKSSQNFEIIDRRDFGLSDGASERLFTTLEKVASKFSLKIRCVVSISGQAEANHGFGTGTCVRLAAIEGLLILNGISCSEEELVTLSGRGGTSGVGIRTYFDGGLVVDIGRINNDDQLAPSSSVEFQKPIAKLLTRMDMPNWKFGMCLPDDLRGLSDFAEKEFFESNTPIAEEEVWQSIYSALFGVTGSVMDHDILMFQKALRQLQKCGFKRKERGFYRGDLLRIEQALYEAGAKAVGMSSLGPLLFFFGDDIEKVIKKASDKLPSCRLWSAVPHNTGRKVECLS